MFFFEGKEWKSLKEYSCYLHRCGTTIPRDQKENLFEFIEKNLESHKGLIPLQRETFEKAFGEERSFEKIKKDVSDILSETHLRESPIR